MFRLRNLTELTQEKFADKIGVTRPYVSQLENNLVDISLSKFIDYCSVFKIDPVDIFNEKMWK